jgi:hypothetical protein
MSFVADRETSEAVKLICGIIAVNENAVSVAIDALKSEYGEIDLESDVMPFDFTDYYEEEMGKGLLRKFVAFAELIDPGALADIKIRTNELEKRIAKDKAEGAKRPVNLDPGYVEASKLVLATTKNFSHRIYLRDGIYGEVTLIVGKGRFMHFDWTFPDYRTEKYKSFFEAVRALYRKQLQER